MIIVTGTFVAYWPEETCGVLSKTGLPFVGVSPTGERPSMEPFFHLYTYMTGLGHHDAPVLVQGMAVPEPCIAELMHDLAVTLAEIVTPPAAALRINLNADPQECFEKAITDRRDVPFADVHRVPVVAFPFDPKDTVTIAVPPHTASNTWQLGELAKHIVLEVDRFKANSNFKVMKCNTTTAGST